MAACASASREPQVSCNEAHWSQWVVAHKLQTLIRLFPFSSRRKCVSPLDLIRGGRVSVWQPLASSHFISRGGASTNLKVRSNTSNTTTAEKYAETFSFFPPRPLCSAEPLKKIRLAENALKVFSRAETWLFFLPRASSRFLPRASGIRDAGRRSATKRIADQPQPRQ